MKTITLNLNDKEAIYLQLYKKIKDDILNGYLKPNEKLPSKRELHNYLNISINTIMQAYNLLVDEGFIVSVEKKGYFVSNYNIKLSKKEKIVSEDVKKEINYKYDFTTRNIDYSIFPLYTLSKITKNTIYNEAFTIKANHNGYKELRETISKYLYETKGINVSYHNIIIGSGIEYLLTLLMNILPSTTYGIENPGYDKIRDILLNNDKKIEYLPLDNDGVVINKNVDCIYTTPANQFPSGIKMSLNRKLEIVKEFKDKYIIEDDFDSEFKYLSNISTSLYALSPNNTIMLKTFSRTISPSIRLSYMILPDKLLEIYNKKYSFYSSTVSTFDQMVANEFIKDGYYSRHLNKTKSLYLEKRNMIINILKNNKNIYIYKDLSYLSLIVRIDNLNKEKFINKCIEYSINIDLMDKYYFLNNTSNELIIGYSSVNKNILNEGINLLNNIINECIEKRL